MIKESKEHLKSVNETYGQHFKIAIKIALLMILGGFQAIVHAVCPGVFKISASDKIKTLHKIISDRQD
jgi:hypothetical protein